MSPDARIKVACINWTHPDAPHALVYLLDEDNVMGATTYCDTWTEAIEAADRWTWLLRRAQLRAREVVS